MRIVGFVQYDSEEEQFTAQQDLRHSLERKNIWEMIYVETIGLSYKDEQAHKIICGENK